MKVLFDPQVFAWQRYGGISRLFAELYREYTTKDYGVELFVPLWYGDNVYAKDSQMPQRSLLTDRHFLGKSRISKVINTALFPKLTKQADPDIVHPSYYDDSFRRSTREIPFILTVHDMIHERYHDTFFTRDKTITRKKKELVHSAARIIAVSEATKRDLIELFEVQEKKINVVYHGNSLTYCNNKKKEQTQYDRPYILFVGERSWYKNFLFFLSGIAPLIQNKDLDLWCVGGGPFTRKEKRLMARLNVLNRIFQFNLSEAKLSKAYMGALVFVFPSLYEGFGIPILEAFSQHCPVVASDIPVFREIAGDAAVYFDPSQPEALRAVVERVIDDTALRQALTTQGAARGKLFSWQRCAAGD